jgi:mannose-6-phosphate isomerase-like protein (cupin superfamily)
VLKGRLTVTYKDGTLEVNEGQAVRVLKGEWVQYSTSGEEGAEYIAVCLPAFSPDIVHRDQ